MRILARRVFIWGSVVQRCFKFGLPVVRNPPNGLEASPVTARRYVSSGSANGKKIPYSYREFNDGEYEIRLLELYQPRDAASAYVFQCRLVHVTLKDPPTYDSVSYSWGDLKYRRDLVVDGVAVEVSVSLREALQQLWRMGKTRIWVVYLCINQADNDEKSGQVRMMDTIFAKARNVYAWLGAKSHDSNLAMAVPGASKLSKQVNLPEEVEVACDAIIRLFSRSYWSRCWVIQEICRARVSVIVCGKRYMHWGTMMKRLDRLGTSIPAQYAQYLIAPLRHMRYRDQNRFRADTETGLIPLLIASRKSLASDPRDKLFALLSLAKDGRVLVPTPNYSQTVEQVFYSTAKCTISEHDRTDVILLAHRTRGARRLPSWMPVWANMHCRPPPWVVNCLDQPRPRLATYNRIRDGVLEVRGSYLEKISHILDMASFDDNAGCQDRDTAVYATSASVVYSLCVGVMSGDEKPDHALQTGLVHLLKDMRRRVKEPAGTQSSALADWISHNCNRRIGAYTLREHLERHSQDAACIDPPPSPRGQDDMDKLAELQSNAEDGFDTMERLRMKFAVTETGSLIIVCRDAQPGDELYILQNCPLPVVLRRDDGSRTCTFIIGEVFPSEAALGKAKTSPEAGVSTTVLIA
ncbi:HET-domain-containing protein [Xylariaceae sp. FL0594]|nr:HET-domain-containing protein [Xylariaceae sp. FL0594]